MAETAAGSGAAFNATIRVRNNRDELQRALDEAIRAEKADWAAGEIARLEAKVAKFREHLAGAEAALAEARARHALEV